LKEEDRKKKRLQKRGKKDMDGRNITGTGHLRGDPSVGQGADDIHSQQKKKKKKVHRPSLKDTPRQAKPKVEPMSAYLRQQFCWAWM